MDPNLGRSCSVQVGAKLCHLGGKLGRSFQVGPKLGPCWPKLTPADFAAISDRNGAFGRFWADLQNVQITTAGNRLWVLTPELKLYQSGRSVRSHPLLNYHASAPSVRAVFSASHPFPHNVQQEFKLHKDLATSTEQYGPTIWIGSTAPYQH